MSAEEKQTTLPSKEGENYYACSFKPRRNQLARRCLFCLFISVLLVGTLLLKLPGFIVYTRLNNPSSFTVLKPEFSIGQSYGDGQCPQAHPLSPKRNTFRLDVMDRFLSSAKYEAISAKRLSKAVRYRTVSYDKMGYLDLPPDDPLYQPFRQFFLEFIVREFRLVTRELELKRVNEHGLLYTWEGSNPNLKPTVLLAHTDVVPVDDSSLDEWSFDPWAGDIAEGKVWGRGSVGKHATVSILEAVEALIAAGYKPRRTLLLSFGFDGEIGGQKGGARLAKEISELYDEPAIIVGEGGAQATQWGRDMLIVGVTEKGQMPVNVEIRAPGGHASLPVEHTGIGIMSQIVAEIEALQYPTYLSDNHPMIGFLTCAQEHADGFPAILKELLKDRLDGDYPPFQDDKLAIEFVKNAGLLRDPVKWSITTAKSVNVIQGGVQVNALPEHVISSTDYRIHIAENSESIQEDISAIVERIAEDHNLTYVDFDSHDTKTPDRSIRVWADWSTEPVNISPSRIDPRESTPWSILAGTSTSVLGPDLIVSPGMVPTNGDARHFEDVSPYIYRYSPGTTFGDTLNGYVVNEAMRIDHHVTGVKWYSKFIRNMDEATFPGEKRGGRW